MKREYLTMSSEDFGTLAICAVRYSMGRQTYMPSAVQAAIKYRLKYLDTRDINVMLKDCERQEEMGLWGDERIDKPGWIKFRELLQKEKEKRGE